MPTSAKNRRCCRTSITSESPPCGSGLAREEASTSNTVAVPAIPSSRASPLPQVLCCSHLLRWAHTSVGAGLLAKRPVHPTQLLCLQYRLRGQVRSHRFCVVHTYCSGHKHLWERACSRRGQYIQHSCCARNTAFASKPAPTGSVLFTPIAVGTNICGSGLAREEAGASNTIDVAGIPSSRASPLPQVVFTPIGCAVAVRRRPCLPGPLRSPARRGSSGRNRG